MSKILSYKSNTDLDYPTCRPSLDLDFTQEKLDPRITFTRGSIGTRVNRNRLIETVAANQPRFDYDPMTGECRGLLIEESRQNLLTYSEDFATTWMTNNYNVITNATIAPNGTLTADKLITINAATFHDLFKSPSLASNLYTLSIFAKAAEQSLIRLRIDDGIIARNVIFNLLDGSISNSLNVTSSTITPYPNGWYRCSITVTTNILNVVFNTPYPYLGSGTSGIYIWGAQLETGAFPTSYIPTLNSTVTRSADNVNMTGTNFSSWYNQNEGTFFTKSLTFSLTVAGHICSAEQDANNRISTQYFTPGAISFIRYKRNIYAGDIIETPTNVFNKIAHSYSKTQNNYSVNGKLDTFKFNLLELPIPTVFYIGVYGTFNIGYLCGHISRLTYYPKAIKLNQLQYLTQ